MKTRWLWLVVSVSLLTTVRAASPPSPPPPAVTNQDLLQLSRLKDAQGMALAQGKPVGFLLTWPMFFPGAKDFNRNGALSAAYFCQAFKDQVVLVNVDHTTGDLDHLPEVAANAFHSPAEGGYAPCLCLTDAKFTRLIGMIPLWQNPIERELLFKQYQAVIADQSRWGEAARRVAVVDKAAAAPAAPAASVAPVADTAPTPRPAATPPAPASAGLAREMELTRQAEQQQQKVTPSP